MSEPKANSSAEKPNRIPKEQFQEWRKRDPGKPCKVEVTSGGSWLVSPHPDTIDWLEEGSQIVIHCLREVGIYSSNFTGHRRVKTKLQLKGREILEVATTICGLVEVLDRREVGNELSAKQYSDLQKALRYSTKANDLAASIVEGNWNLLPEGTKKLEEYLRIRGKTNRTVRVNRWRNILLSELVQSLNRNKVPSLIQLAS